MRKKSWHILIGVLLAILLAGLVFIAVMPKNGQSPTGEAPTATGSQQAHQSGKEEIDKDQPETGNDTPASEKETQSGQKPGGEKEPESGGKQPEKEPAKPTTPPVPTHSGKQDRYETPRDYS